MKLQIILFVLTIYCLNLNAQLQIGNDIDGEAAGDNSGWSVSLSSDGSRLAIGAYHNDGTASNAGHTRVYELNGGSWTQLGADIDGEAGNDLSGNFISLSSDGNRVAIGAYNNDETASNAGHIRVYELSGGNWMQLGADINGESAFDNSGISVSLSSDGNRVGVGAYSNDGNGSNAGHVRIYELSGGSWIQLGADIDGEAAIDRSGYSVSLSSDGSRVAIGAYGNDSNGSNSGHVRVYELSGGSWIQLGADIDGEAAGDNSGYSVSLSSDGNTVAIGAYLNSGNGNLAGHVRVYELIGGNWIQIGSDIDGESDFTRSGYSVSLSSDGTRVAIGGDTNDGNGNNSGHVRVYELSGGDWIQLGSDMDGEAEGDRSGFEVSLSSDGHYVAIGAPFNDGNGNDTGHVRVYDLDAPLPTDLIYFQGRAFENENKLTWATASEVNNDYYIVEHCIDGISFYPLGLIEGNGNSSITQEYEVIHRLPQYPINYYRLKQVDYNGAFNYSDIINITSSIDDNIKIYPNPTSGIFNIRGLEKNTTILVSDFLGRNVVTINNNQIDLTGFPKGIYFVSIFDGEQLVTKRVLKE